MLLFHAIRIYVCGCIGLYINRWALTVCCCLCKMLNCCYKYTDSSFPPDDKSLGNVGGDSANDKSGKTDASCTWLRAGQDAKMQLFHDGINPNDICQGALGDCWLLAAMSCMAEHYGAIEQLFLTRERNPRGKYQVRLFDGTLDPPRWVNLTIDDHVPCDKAAHEQHDKFKPLFTQPKGDELWVLLLEKAFAKLCGSYASLEGGSTIWALRAMTGDPARWFSYKEDADHFERWDMKQEADPDSKRESSLICADEKIKSDDFFDILCKYDKLGCVLCGSGASGSHGLVSGHAYAILQVRKIKNFRLLQFRNPWGSGEWTGDWSDKSDLWNQHSGVKKEAGFTDANDGAFWMCWEDVLKNWKRIGVVDRTIDVKSLHFDPDGPDGSCCAPTTGCCKGCCTYWCMCYGAKRVYFPHHSSEETVEADKGCLSSCTIL